MMELVVLCVNPGYQTQAVRTRGKNLYPLNQLSGSCFSHAVQDMKFSMGTSPMGTWAVST